MTTGVLIQILNQDGGIPQNLYYKILGNTIVEHTALAALRSEHVRKTIVFAPIDYKAEISGGTFYSSRINVSGPFDNNKCDFFYYSNNMSVIEGAYRAARKNDLDKVIIINANSPLVAPWMINFHARSLSKDDSKILLSNSNSGLEIVSMSYANLTDLYLFSEEKDSWLKMLNQEVDNEEFILNKGDVRNVDLNIDNTNTDLRFLDPSSQLKTFEYLLGEMKSGAEINDLIGDINVESEKAESE